jgi:hypothetical protein
MGNVQARLIDDATVIAKDVDVDFTWAPAFARGAAELALDPLEDVQQGPRFERGLHFEDLVQKLRLVTNADWLRLVHPRGADKGNARVRQCGPSCPEVSVTVTEVAA